MNPTNIAPIIESDDIPPVVGSVGLAVFLGVEDGCEEVGPLVTCAMIISVGVGVFDGVTETATVGDIVPVGVIDGVVSGDVGDGVLVGVSEISIRVGCGTAEQSADF